MITKEQKNNSKDGLISRSPIVVVMGHIDHGKSALLDYIRKTNLVDKEAGGITQHIGAYEVEVKCGDKHEHKTTKITFLDTPGHEAFSQMRLRGAKVADVAILIVSAEDGPKPQTVEACEAIKDAEIPFVVAINKIDKPGAEVERTKTQLTKNQIFLEGYGGDVASVGISAKTGEGVDELLDMILLLSEMAELKADASKNASGVVIESHIDTKRGVTATLLIQNGTLKKGMFVVAGGAMTPVRIFEDFQGHVLEEASFSSPVKITGFDKVPEAGSRSASFDSKKEAEKAVEQFSFLQSKDSSVEQTDNSSKGSEKLVIPLLTKTDVSGSIGALRQELKKLEDDDVALSFISEGVGKITENDVKLVSGAKRAIIFGFNVSIEPSAMLLAERFDVKIFVSDIIYKISEWLEEEIDKRKKENPKDEIIGTAEVLLTFSTAKTKKVVGVKVVSGKVIEGGLIVVKRKKPVADGAEKEGEEGGGEIDKKEEFEEVGKGKIGKVQRKKEEVREAGAGEQCGLMLEVGEEVLVGDVVEVIKKAK